MSHPATSGINPPFGGLSPSLGQVAYVLLNRLPLNKRQVSYSARLAYIRHAASVRPEPGSNSPSDLDPGARSRFVADPCARGREKGSGVRQAEASRTRSRPAPSVSLLSHCSVFKDPARQTQKTPARFRRSKWRLQLHSVSLERGGVRIHRASVSILYQTPI